MAQPTPKEILTAIQSITAAIPTADLDGIKDELTAVRVDIQDLKEKLLDPTSGIIVRNNQNKHNITKLDENVTDLFEVTEVMRDDVNELKTYKKGIVAAFYVIYAASIGLIVNAIKNALG